MHYIPNIPYERKMSLSKLHIYGIRPTRTELRIHATQGIQYTTANYRLNICKSNMQIRTNG